MKAILIKTDEEKVEEVEFNGTLEHAYELLGCSIIERATLENGDDVWVDEEGLINGNDCGTFRVGNFRLVGRGLITGTVEGEDGEEWGDATTTVEEAVKMVEFY